MEDNTKSAIPIGKVFHMLQLRRVAAGHAGHVRGGSKAARDFGVDAARLHGSGSSGGVHGSDRNGVGTSIRHHGCEISFVGG